MEAILFENYKAQRPFVVKEPLSLEGLGYGQAGRSQDSISAEVPGTMTLHPEGSAETHHGWWGHRDNAEHALSLEESECSWEA